MKCRSQSQALADLREDMSKTPALICAFVLIGVVFSSPMNAAASANSTKIDCRKLSSAACQVSLSPILSKLEAATTKPQLTFVALADRVSQLLLDYNVMQVEKMQKEAYVETYKKYICMMNPRQCEKRKVVLPSGNLYRMNVLLGGIGPKANPITVAPSSYFSGRPILED